jgi:hypothetical protein
MARSEDTTLTAAKELMNLRTHLKAARDAGVLIVAGTDVGNPYRFPGIQP